MSIFSVYSILLLTTWPTISELMYANKLTEARSKVLLTVKQGLIFGVVTGGLLIIIAPWILSVVSTGKVDLVPNIIYLAWLFYILIRIWCDTFAMGLLSIGKSSVINKYVPFQAAISLTGQYMGGTKFGVVGVIFGLIVSFVLTAAWILPWKFYKLTNSKK